MLTHRTRRALVLGLSIFGSSLMLAACGGGDGDSSQAAAPTPPTNTPPTTPPSGGNSAPTISGSPSGSAMQGSQYSFTPVANDTDGDTLTFSVSGMPGWATFNASTGALSGTPGQGDVGSSATVQISVTDGQATANLASFTINVVATASGAATLSWTPPTQKTDGSPLNDLAGYKIYWGTSQGSYSNSITLNNPGLTSYVVDQLTPATWYFVATALDSAGIESQFSNAASKTIN